MSPRHWLPWECVSGSPGAKSSCSGVIHKCATLSPVPSITQPPSRAHRQGCSADQTAIALGSALGGKQWALRAAFFSIPPPLSLLSHPRKRDTLYEESGGQIEVGVTEARKMFPLLKPMNHTTRVASFKSERHLCFLLHHSPQHRCSWRVLATLLLSITKQNGAEYQPT